MPKKSLINPLIRDVWLISKVVWMVLGFNLGLFLYTFTPFLYTKFGGSDSGEALKLTVWTVIIAEVCIFLSEVPTGAMGDRFGRKKMVVASFALYALACFIRMWIPFVFSVQCVFILAVLDTVVSAFSYTFFSGCFVAWIVDTIAERNIPEGHGSILARSWSYRFVAQIIGSIVGLTLYLTGYIFYAFCLGSTISVLCALFCLVIMDEKRSVDPNKVKASLRSSVKALRTTILDGLKISIAIPPVFYLILLYSGFKFLSDLVNYLWPVAMQENFGVGNKSPYWFVAVFISLVTAILGSKILEKILAKDGKKTNNIALWLWYVVVNLVIGGVVIAFGVNNIKSSASLPLLIVTVASCQFGYGFLTPAYNTLINNYIPAIHSDKRATIMSAGSMFLSLLTITLIFPSSGPSGQMTAVGWMLPGVLLIVATLVLHILMRRYQRKIGEIPVPIAAPLAQGD